VWLKTEVGSVKSRISGLELSGSEATSGSNTASKTNFRELGMGHGQRSGSCVLAAYNGNLLVQRSLCVAVGFHSSLDLLDALVFTGGFDRGIGVPLTG